MTIASYIASRSKRRHARRRRGMTLVEILVAIAILSIVTTLIYGGFAQTQLNKQRLEGDLDRYHEITTGLDRMTRELASAYVSAHLNPNESLQTTRTAFVGTDRGNGDRIDFTSFAHDRLFRNAHESDQCEISYFVTHDPDDSEKKVLARREQNRIDDDPTRGGRVEIAVHDVEDFDVEYLDPESVEWARSWDTTHGGGRPNLLPAQVKIILTVPPLHGHGRPLKFGTRASLPIRFGLNHAIHNP